MLLVVLLLQLLVLAREQERARGRRKVALVLLLKQHWQEQMALIQQPEGERMMWQQLLRAFASLKGRMIRAIRRKEKERLEKGKSQNKQYRD